MFLKMAVNFPFYAPSPALRFPFPPPALAVPNATAPYFIDSLSLLIRHLPEEYSYSDAERLLTTHGARTVKYFGSTGRLKNIAIAEFVSPNAAISALQKLHQIKLKKRRLVVEFTDSHTAQHYPARAAIKPPSTGEISQVYYKYPVVSESILTNVACEMRENPKFYVQVLHLMNLMDLAVPFGAAREESSMRVSTQPETAVTTEITMDLSSGSDNESEIEESTSSVTSLRKRPALESNRLKNSCKKVKVAALIEATVIPAASAATNIKTVFDQGNYREKQKLQIKVPETMPSEPVRDEGIIEGFGTVGPTSSTTAPISSNFLSEEDLAANRITQSDMLQLAVFRNYQRGSPSAKLYVKNLAKSVDEEDLKFVFGRFINWQMERESSSFSVRLMTTGRMKGQAFITMPSQIKAEAALQAINGYLLQGRHMVIVRVCPIYR